MSPQRIRLSRAKGWRKPDGAVVVSRPSKWGNPFNWKECPPNVGPEDWARGTAVDLYRGWLWEPDRAALRADALIQLRGHDLACWCPLDAPCHADVLLEIANAPEAPQ